MSVQDEAVAAAQQAYPMGITAEGEREIRRVPYAQGYQAGYAAALAGLGAVSEAEVDAGAYALDPWVWGNRGSTQDEARRHDLRVDARRVLEAARQVRRA